MVENIRNIGIIAHIDAGKTTTSERILYYTGKSHRIGEVDSGSATMDWMEQEQDRGITIVAAATTCHWQVRDDEGSIKQSSTEQNNAEQSNAEQSNAEQSNAKQNTAKIQINLIDTPGHVDFTAEVERSLRVLDGAIAVLCAVKGIEPQTETVWRQSEHYHIPRLVYINKMDRAGANFENVLDQLRNKFAVRPLPLYLPIGAENNYSGNIDVLRREELYFRGENGEQIERRPLSPEREALARQAYDYLIDVLSESEDRIAELYLEGAEIPIELCYAAIRRLCLAKELVPVYAGSSLKNKGVQQLLDGTSLYLPAPSDVPPLKVPRVGEKKSKLKTLESNRLVELHSDPAAPLAALIFKVQYHKEMGMLCYVRVYSGTLKVNSNIFNVRKGKRERLNRLIQMHANNHKAISELKAGEIGVVVGFKLAQTGDTICDEKSQVLLESMDFPEPVISIAIEPQSSSGSDKLNLALEHLEREDPTFHVKEDGDTGQILISGMGELHLEVLCTRLRDEFKLQFRTGQPRVAHREALSGPCSGTGRFEHEIAGELHEISLKLDLQPRASSATSESSGAAISSSNNHFVNLCDTVPGEYSQLIEASVLRHLESGFRLGYPAINVEVLLKSCSYNNEEPYEPGFEAAVACAIDQAVRKQETLLLEPIMKLTIMTPAEYVGDVISQLTQRNGQVHSMDSQPGCDVIHATALMSRLFGYSTTLRSQTQGRASFSLEFDHFAPNL